MMAAELILGSYRAAAALIALVFNANGGIDSKPGMLDMMVSSSYPNQSGPTPQFDEETKELARKLKA